MASCRSALAPAHFELRDVHPNRHAFTAIVAVGPVSKRPTPPEPQPDQLAVNAAIDKVAGRCDLRPCQPVRQVTARVRSGRVELQRGERKVVELGHIDSPPGVAWFHMPAGGDECTNRVTASANSLRDIGRAPRRAKCAVSCWQSISGMSLRLSMSTRCTSATLEASVSRANIDSPKNIRPIEIPYRPPARVSPTHASTEWAYPSRCNRA